MHPSALEGLPNAPEPNADLEGSTDPCTKNDEGAPNALGSEFSGQY